MAGIQAFADLSAEQESLFKDGFLSQAALLTVQRAVKDLTLKTKIGSTQEQKLVYNASVKVVKDKFHFEPKIANDGAVKLSGEWRVSPEIKLEAEEKLTAKGGAVSEHDPSVSAEFGLRDGLLKVGLNKDLGLSITGTFGKPEYGVGVDSKFSLKKAELLPFSLAAWYKQEQSIAVLRLEEVDLPAFNYGALAASLFLSTTPTVKVGSLVKVGLSDHSTTIELAGQYSLAPNTLLKAKVHSRGQVSAAWIEALRPDVKLSISASANSLKVFRTGLTDAGLGFRLDFTA